jgi:hypothetical protein
MGLLNMSTSTDVKVIFNYLNQEEYELLVKCLKTINKGGDTIRIEPFRRYGFSGSKLFLVFFSPKGGVPFIVKIHKKTSIAKEYSSITSVKNYFEDTQHINPPIYHKNLGAIIYKYFKKNSKLDSSTFEDIVYDIKSQDDDIVKMLDSVYTENRENAYNDCREEQANWLENYGWYLRTTESGISKSEDFIDCVLNNNTSNERIIIYGREVSNPISFIKKLNFNEKLLMAPVHGDLHANNIVIDKTNNPHLIDFEWASVKHHFLVDFSLMECSLRFATLPNHLCTELLLKHDEDLTKTISGLSCTQDCSIKNEIKDSNKQYICRCCKLINKIRSHARSAYNSDAFERHYLISLYLMLFGLFQFRQYPKDRCLLNLGFLSTEIQGYLDEK